MKNPTWQNPEQLFVAQVLKKQIYNSVAELRFNKKHAIDDKNTAIESDHLGLFLNFVRQLYRLIELI